MKTDPIPRPSSAIFAGAVLFLVAAGHGGAAVTPGGALGDSAVFTSESVSPDEALDPAGAAGGTGPVLTHSFDTTKGTAGGSYELNPMGDATEIALSLGRHLVLYDSQFTDEPGTNRTEVQSRLSLAGTPLPMGHSQGYTRNNSGADETITTGGAIITVAADDDILKLESYRTDTNTGQVLSRVNGTTGIQFLKLDDAWDYLSLEVTADSAPIDPGVDVVYDTNNSPGTMGTAFSFTASSGDITLNEPGKYLLMANTGIKSNNPATTTRTIYGQELTLDGVAVPGTRMTTYIRGSANGENCYQGVTAIGTILDLVTGGQTLNVEVSKLTGDSASISAGNTALTIVKLPATAQTISLLDSTTQDVNAGTVAAPNPITFSTQSATSSKFTHTPTESPVTVNGAGDYLFLGSIFADAVSADRVVVQHGFSVDGGSLLNYGQGAEYNRNNSTGGLEDESGSWSGAILDLADASTVELGSAILGNAGVADAGTRALIGLSIESLIPSNDPVVGTNKPLVIIPGSTGTITNLLLETIDIDTPPSGLTYTVDTAPAGGTLRHTVDGPIGIGGTFTQDDINSDRLEFDSEPSETVGGFDFTVSDGSASDGGTFVVNVEWPSSIVTIATGNPEVVEGGTATWTVTASLAPVGADLTVGIAYSGTASDGSDFTGVTPVVVPAGGTTADLDVTTIDDGIFEGCEWITASIDSLSGATLNPVIGSPGNATIALYDGPSAPTATNLTQVVIGTGNVPVADIVAFSPNATYLSRVNPADLPFYVYSGQSNVSIFSDGRPDDDFEFDIDATGPALDQASGMSIEIEFTPQAADLTGSVMVWEVGGTTNGSAIHLVNGIPHLASKANAAATSSAPTDDGSVAGVFTDLDWTDDDCISVPIGTTPVTPGVPNRIALTYDIVGDTVTYSINGGGATAVSLTGDGTNLNWRGDHTTANGAMSSQIGGSNDVAGSPFNNGIIVDLAGGISSVSCIKFWNESGGSIVAVPGAAEPITATLTISGWSAGAGDLTADSGNGETYSAGVWSITSDAAAVNAALAAVEFITGTLDPATILVEISNGTGATAGSVTVSAAAPTTVYVDDDFAGLPGSVIPDADGGAPVSPATLGFDAFADLASALAAVGPAGTIVVNDGDYGSEVTGLGAVPDVALRLAGSGGSPGGSTVIIGSLSAVATNSIDLGAETIVLGNDSTDDTIECGITGAGGSLTKQGTDRLIVQDLCSYTGTTTVTDGFLRVGYFDTFRQAELAGDGPVVVDAPGVLEFNVGIDGTTTNTITQTGVISGTGEVRSMGDGKLVFDGPGANTFSGGFELGDGASSTWDGVSQGAKAGFVEVNHSDHLGTGPIRSRGGQLQAGSPGVVIPNQIDIDQGGFRCGGTTDFELSGTIVTINNVARGFGNYGLEGLDLTASGPVIIDNGTMSVEGSNNRDNGSWTFTGPISGVTDFGFGDVRVQDNFDNGVVTFSGVHTYQGAGTFRTGVTYYNATHTGGLPWVVQGGATLAGAGSTDAPVTIDAGATLSPGASVGTFATGDLTIAGTLEVDVDDTAGSGHDQVVVTGLVDISAATLVVNLGGGFEAAPAGIVVIANDDVDAVAGPFVAGVPFSVDYLGSGRLGDVSVVGGDGNDVSLVAGTESIIGSWRLANFGSSGNDGNAADDSDAGDLDALVNLLEFGFGTDPNTPDNQPLAADGSLNGTPTTLVSFDGGVTFDALFIRRDDFGQPGSLAYTVQFSSDLVTFHDSTAAVTIVADSSADPAYHVASVPYTPLLPDGKKARFYRVKVELVP